MNPFLIDIPEGILEDLRRRLINTRFIEPTPIEAWDAGTSVNYLRDLVRYWAEEYDWRAVESRLNTYPHYTTRIGGQLIHFVHVRSDLASATEAMPIILTHGWPYTFVEMLDVVPLLVAPGPNGGRPEDVFDVVIPSLPGYGFSEPFTDRPFLSRTVAEVWHELMTEALGYRRYATYGEDIGAGVSDWTAALHPESVIGVFATHAAFPAEERRADLTREEEAFIAWLAEKWRYESAYSQLQGTKPDTLAAALHDSPAGLAAWIVEKLRTWSGGQQGFEEAWSTEEVLTTVTLYWATGTIGTSFRAYFEGRSEETVPLIEVPAGVSVQRGERGFPRSYAERTYRDLRLWKDLPRGGHFTVKQTPDLVAADMRDFFRPLRS